VDALQGGKRWTPGQKDKERKVKEATKGGEKNGRSYHAPKGGEKLFPELAGGS